MLHVQQHQQTDHEDNISASTNEAAGDQEEEEQLPSLLSSQQQQASLLSSQQQQAATVLDQLPSSQQQQQAIATALEQEESGEASAIGQDVYHAIAARRQAELEISCMGCGQPNDPMTLRSWTLPGERRVRCSWSEDEIAYLLQGIEQFGAGKWKTILQNFPFKSTRKSTDLRDKWRNLTSRHY